MCGLVTGVQTCALPIFTLRPFESRVLHCRATAAPSHDPVKAHSHDTKESDERLRALAANRIAIEKMTPELDGGRFPVKRVVGDTLTVEADVFGDGHDTIAASVRYRETGAGAWREAPMRSEERRGGTECVSTCRSRLSP